MRKQQRFWNRLFLVSASFLILMTSLIYVIFFHIWANALIVNPCSKFRLIGPKTTKIIQAASPPPPPPPPPNLNMSKKPSPIRVNLTIALLWINQSDNLFLIILSTKHLSCHGNLEDECENLWNLAPYLTLPRAHGGLFTSSATAACGGGVSPMA